MARRVLISTSSFARVSAQPLERLQTAGFEYVLNPHGRKLEPTETVELLREVDGVIAGTERLDRGTLTDLPRLKVISRVGTGLENVDLDAARELGIRVFNTPDAHVDSVAELTLGGLLDVLRSISRGDRTIRSGRWDKPMGTLLRGKTVGIVGLGRVGKRLVELLAPFRVEVMAMDPYPSPEWAEPRGVRYLPLSEVLRQSDIVTLHLPYTPEQHHLLNEERLASMKKGAVLVNCGRGGLVDERALVESLRSSHLSGAFLDTFEREPYTGELAELPTVVLTPHIGSYAAEARLDMELQAVENLVQCFNEQGS